jgi:hypothetical protein
VAAIIVTNTAMYAVAPWPSNSGTEPSPNSAPRPPTRGDIQSWARLYPGAVVDVSSVTNNFGLTDWDVQYTAHASPDQIDNFYRGVARGIRFNDDSIFIQQRYFEQKSSNNEFYYSMYPEGGGTRVVITFRTFGQPPTQGATK